MLILFASLMRYLILIFVTDFKLLFKFVIFGQFQFLN
jgi:hypothetical protein